MRTAALATLFLLMAYSQRVEASPAEPSQRANVFHGGATHSPAGRPGTEPSLSSDFLDRLTLKKLWERIQEEARSTERSGDLPQRSSDRPRARRDEDDSDEDDD